MLMDRFAGKSTRAGNDGADCGTRDYAVNGLTQLYVATLVVLHVFPAATARALQPQMAALLQTRGTAPQSEDAPSTPQRDGMVRPRPTTPDTERQAEGLGWFPADSPGSSEPTTISSEANSNGKRDGMSVSCTPRARGDLLAAINGFPTTVRARLRSGPRVESEAQSCAVER